MNRLARHELAEREFIRRHVGPGQVAIRASTSSPCDLLVLRPGEGGVRLTIVEVKTARGRKTSDLTLEERKLVEWAREHGVAFVLARYRVVGERVESEEITSLSRGAIAGILGGTEADR